MHAIKGGWVGQTFALAKQNESGGRKSRIRRSKEERKEMVESFIKRYQSLNNGSFPSLNLTHKEVGGSFYTVREIVRDVIQENRVLGPAKLLPEELKAGDLLEQYPLGTISAESQASLCISPNGSPASNQQQFKSDKSDLISDVLCMEHQQGFDEGTTVNESHVVTKTEETWKPKFIDVQLSEPVETERLVEQVAASSSKVTQMADVIVETFPLQTVTEPTECFDENSGEVRDLHATFGQKCIENVHLGPGNNGSVSDGMSFSADSSLVNNKEVEKPAGPPSERKSDLVIEKAVERLVDTTLGSLQSVPAEEHTVHDAQPDTDVEVKLSHDDKAIAETKVINATNGIEAKPLTATNTDHGSSKSMTRELVVENKAKVHHGTNSQEVYNPTLGRPKLESWEGASKSPATPGTNPLLAIFKAFIDAFAKLWSE